MKPFITTPLPLLLEQSSIAAESSSSASDEGDAPYGALKILSDSTSTEAHLEKEKKSEEVVEDELATTPHEEKSEEVAEDEESHNIAMMPQDAHEEIVEPVVSDLDDESDAKVEETTSVEQRLKKISEEIEKYSSSENESDIGRQSFFSLSDLIKTLRPSDKKVIPQIDSDYSNTMRVLGETSSIVSGEEARKLKDVDLKTRALY